MAKTDTYMTVRCFITPSKLREIASNMEGLWATSRPGEDLTAATVGGDACEVRFVIDQDAMLKEVGTEERPRRRGERIVI